MPHAAPRSIAALAATHRLVLWVLLQTSPRVEVLAVSESRNRLIFEMAVLYGADKDCGLNPDFRLSVRPIHDMQILL